jgi:heme/copper-type cytochrome/quinol oxidase subunit 3
VKEQTMAVDRAISTEPTYTVPGKSVRTVGVATYKLAVWIFLASEVIFFSALIGAGILLRVQTPGGTDLSGASALSEWPLPGEVLNVPLTSLNTFLLIVSSVTVVKALQSLQEGKQGRFRLMMLATLAVGVTFLGVQVYEYIELYGHGLTFTQYVNHHTHETVTSPYGTAFYLQTGFHGAHVFVGVLWMLVVIARAFAGLYDEHNTVGVEIFGLYWHFVDLVWILLFTIVYLV